MCGSFFATVMIFSAHFEYLEEDKEKICEKTIQNYAVELVSDILCTWRVKELHHFLLISIDEWMIVYLVGQAMLVVT